MEFPYPRGEDSFIPQELGLIANDFDIVIIPFKANLISKPAQLSKEIQIDARFSMIWDMNYLFWSETFPTLLDINLWRAISNNPRVLKNMMVLKGIVGELRTSRRFAKWFEYNYKEALTGNKVTIYCWWSNWIAISASLLSQSYEMNLVVRTHGQDLYDFRSTLGVQPFQPLVMRRANWVLPASQDGENYLVAKYPEHKRKILFCKVGTVDYKHLNNASEDGTIRVLSVSSLDSVKRILLLARGLIELHNTYPGINFSWTHIGDGPDIRELKSIISSDSGFNSKVTLRGQISHTEVIGHYKSNSVDLLINVSSSEGTPVSLMEAASFGIPLMATNVGGNPEIVEATQGFLLSASPTETEIAKAVMEFSKLSSSMKHRLRKNARQGWERSYSASLVYGELLNLL